MDYNIINQAQHKLEKVIKEVGLLIKNKFDHLTEINIKGDFGDVVTEADYLAEDILVKAIQQNFPSHQIRSEELGMLGEESDWLWLIDPLDGTNNFVIGLPVIAVSVTLMYRRHAVLGIVYEPFTDRLYASSINKGAYCNNKQITIKESTDLFKGTIGWIQGHKVQNNPQAVKLKNYIDHKFKRMIRLWAPTIQWCMLAKGDIDGIILYNSEGEDLYSGLLMVKEAGGCVIDFNGHEFNGMVDEPYIIACHPQHKEQLLSIVKEGLNSE